MKITRASQYNDFVNGKTNYSHIVWRYRKNNFKCLDPIQASYLNSFEIQKAIDKGQLSFKEKI